MKNSVSTALTGILSTILLSSYAHAASIDFENFSYTGTVSLFDTLSDAQSGSNAQSTHTIPDVTNSDSGLSTNGGNRDAAVFADTDTNAFGFTTAWYWTAPGENTTGAGNPNNTNTGFIQLRDDVGNVGTSVSSLQIGWNAEGDEFTVSASGENAGSDEFARLWPAPTIGGQSSISGGEFINFEFNLTAGFATPTTDGTKSVFPDTVAGSFSGIFENTSNSANAGFFGADLTFSNGTLAQDENLTFPDVGAFDEIAFRSFSAEIPVPATAALLGVGLLGVGAAARRRRRA